MLARHAENMFWAGRYVERAEDTARMLRATLQTSVSAGPQTAAANLASLLRTLRVEVPSEPLDGPAVAELLVATPSVPGSVVTAMGRTRENLRALREQIPSELWEHANRLHLRLAQPGFREELRRDPFAVLDLIRDRCQTISGIISTAMARNEGYRFLILGQTLERAVMTCRLLNVRFPELSHSSYEEMALTLRSASALEAYQRAFHASADPVDVVRFLLLSQRVPRALLFCLQKAEEQLHALGPQQGSRSLQLMGQLRSRVEFAELDELLADLHRTLDDLEDRIRHVADAVATQYFRNAEELDLHSQLLLPGGAR